MGKSALDICIIDDEIVVCKRLQQYLSKANHSVETFVDSRSAIERIDQKRFDDLRNVFTEFSLASKAGGTREKTKPAQ